MVARYNSCGAPTEISRAPYKTRARLYPDSDQEFDLVWYPARDDVPFLRGPHAINSLRWEEDREDWLPLAVGEIFGTERDYNPERGKPTALGLHTCGTKEDFAGDGRIDWNPPFVEYNPDQLPRCCGGVFESEGGVAIGGTATVYRTAVAEGGVAIGGTATVQASAHIVGSGGVALGGVVAPIRGGRGVGGVALGGAATVIETGVSVGRGGVALASGTLLQNYGLTAGSCALAPDHQQLQEYDIITAPGPTVQVWFRFPIVAGVVYHLQVTDMFQVPVAYLFVGQDCGSLALIAPITGVGCTEVSFAKNGWAFVDVVSDTTHAGRFNSYWNVGGC